MRRNMPLFTQARKFLASSTDEEQNFVNQDDFFDSANESIIKVDEIRKSGNDDLLLGGVRYDDGEYDYDGRLAERVTEEGFETENLMQYDQKFADKVRVWCLGGNGGNGCVSYDRENYGFKLPDGGAGGDGGDVYFKSTSRLSSLYELRRAHFKGNNGKPGKG